MSLDSILVVGILVAAAGALVSGRLRVDLTALLVLAALALGGLVPLPQALAGFGSPAVVAVAAMGVISAGLSRTGVADRLGARIQRLDRAGEGRLIAGIMLTAAGLSAFMSNTGVVALMLPMVLEIGRRTGRPPSTLLMPLAQGALLGGMTTLIGTSTNLIVSEAAHASGAQRFGLFDFAPLGGAVLVAGVGLAAGWGWRRLPRRDPLRETFAEPAAKGVGDAYALDAQWFRLHLAADSPLLGRSLADSRLGSALRLNLVAVERNGRHLLDPRPETRLQAGDRLIVLGRPDDLPARHLCLEGGREGPAAGLGLWRTS